MDKKLVIKMSKMSDYNVATILVYKLLNSVYKAVTEELGEEAWDVLWKSGKYLFNEVREEIGIEKGLDVEEAIRRLCQYLRRIGMVEEVRFEFNREEGVLETTVIFPFSIAKYKREAAGPIYLFTSLLSSVLEYLGYEMEREGEHYILEGNKLRERWRITKAE